MSALRAQGQCVLVCVRHYCLQLCKALHSEGLATRMTRRRGLDHGAFIPIMLMYPNRNIPVVQLSMHENLRFEDHVAAGRVLAQFRAKGTLIIGA